MSTNLALTNLTVTSLRLGALNTNCYFIWHPTTRECIIVDPADAGDYLCQTILELKLQPQAILLTHGHFDHVLALLEVQTAFHLPAYLHPADDFLLANAAASAKHWLNLEVDPIPPASHHLDSNVVLTFCQTSWQVIHTPGHTPGSVCFYLPAEKTIVTGDTLFRGSVGRTDFRYSKPQLLLTSLEKLFALPAETTVLPGHGLTTTLGREKNAMSDIITSSVT